MAWGIEKPVRSRDELTEIVRSRLPPAEARTLNVYVAKITTPVGWGPNWRVAVTSHTRRRVSDVVLEIARQVVNEFDHA
jgi:hypothetical protein